MATTIQWRWKPQFRRMPSDAHWRQYGVISQSEAPVLLRSFNDNDPHFEYREAPQIEVKEAE